MILAFIQHLLESAIIGLVALEPTPAEISAPGLSRPVMMLITPPIASEPYSAERATDRMDSLNQRGWDLAQIGNIANPGAVQRYTVNRDQNMTGPAPRIVRRGGTCATALRYLRPADVT